MSELFLLETRYVLTPNGNTSVPLGTDLGCVDLSDVEVRSVDFSGNHLAGVLMSEADLTGACFIGADLRYAICHRTILADTNLHHANLWNADFT